MPEFKTTYANNLPRTNAQTNQKPRPKHQQTHQKEQQQQKYTYQMKLWRKRSLFRYKNTSSKRVSRHKITGTKAFASFFTQRSKGRNKSKKKKSSQENAVEKIKKKVQYAIYRGTGPRKAKRPNKLSLKRHAAWKFPESAAHHKCLLWLPHPLSPRGPIRRRDLFKIQKASYFLTRPFFGKIGKLKRGAMWGPLPLGNTWHAPHSDTQHVLSAGPSSSGFP